MRAPAQPDVAGARDAHGAEEQALREREALLTRRLEAAALAYLAGGVAHDLNNLLTVIVGSADFLGGDPQMGAEQREELLAIQRAGERASEITRQLLAYSRRVPSVPLEVDLAERIGELAPIITRLLGPGIQLELAFGAGLWRVRVDPLHAEHVVTHLALQARQAMPDGGVARLSVNNVRVERMERRGHVMVGSGDYVELCVRDTGPGMSPESIARAFEPFFAAREQPASTDLRLPLVHHLVAHALGHVWIESGARKGTVFHVLFPRFERAEGGAGATGAAGATAAAGATGAAGSGQGAASRKGGERSARKKGKAAVKRARGSRSGR